MVMICYCYQRKDIQFTIGAGKFVDEMLNVPPHSKMPPRATE